MRAYSTPNYYITCTNLNIELRLLQKQHLDFYKTPNIILIFNKNPQPLHANIALQNVLFHVKP